MFVAFAKIWCFNENPHPGGADLGFIGFVCHVTILTLENRKSNDPTFNFYLFTIFVLLCLKNNNHLYYIAIASMDLQ